MIFRLVLFAISMVVTAEGFSQGYPTRPVRVINPFPAGGPVDVVARPLLERLRQELDQPFIMENRPGGGTVIGSEAVAKSTPDGYTLLVTASQHSINPAIYPKLPYDTVKDFAPIAPIAHGPFVLVVHPSVPAQDVKQLIAYAKSAPGKINFGSASSGSGFHMAGEMFKLLAGVNIIHVPYKGGVPALNDLMGGQVSMIIENMPQLLPQVRAGKIRALAVTTQQRSLAISDLPAVAEVLPGYEATTWFGLLAPAKTPQEIVRKVQSDVAKIGLLPDVKERFTGLGADVIASTPDAFATHLRSELVRFSKVIKDANIKAE